MKKRREKKIKKKLFAFVLATVLSIGVIGNMNMVAFGETDKRVVGKDLTNVMGIGKLGFLSDKGMEINVSNYSTDALYKAEHTDELEKDGKVHLRIDYKVSGIGSNSCGPGLRDKYKLQEKDIAFSFTISRL